MDILAQTIQNLSIHHIPLERIAADAGYGSAGLSPSVKLIISMLTFQF